jgi:hypothetical protein
VGRRPGSTFFWVVSLAAFLVGGQPSPVVAQGPVALRVQVIYAANQPGGVDARLGGLVGELQRTFRYSTYQLLEAPQGSAALDQSWRVSLPDNRALEITPTAIQGDQYSLRVHVVAASGRPLVKTAVRLRRGATVLVGGPKHQQGVLIIAISAG